MKILDRYIIRAVISSTLMVSLVIVAIEGFLTLVEQFRFVGENNFTLTDALLFVPMQLPTLFYQLFPIAGFLGAMIGLGRLSSSSQLIVMQVSGFSVLRVAWSVMKAALVMIVVVTIIGEGFGPFLLQVSSQMKQQELFPSNNHALLNAIWMRQGKDFVYIRELKNQDQLFHIVQYRFSKTGALKEASQAQSGERIDGKWKVQGLENTFFYPNHVKTQNKNAAYVHLDFHPRLQVQMKTSAVGESLMNLYSTIRYRQSVGLSTHQFIFSFWQRIFQPLMTIVMIVLAVPFVFGSFRSSAMSVRLMLGVLIGFGFYMLNQLFGPITLVYQFPPILAASIPTFVFLLIGMVLFLRMSKK